MGVLVEVGVEVGVLVGVGVDVGNSAATTGPETTSRINKATTPTSTRATGGSSGRSR